MARAKTIFNCEFIVMWMEGGQPEQELCMDEMSASELIAELADDPGVTAVRRQRNPDFDKRVALSNSLR